MSRAGIEPRRQARRITTQALLSKEVLALAFGMTVVIIVLLLGIRALLSLTGSGWSPTTFGFILGVVAASVPWAMWSAVTQTDGSWSWRVGAKAERLTAGALRRLGPRWRFHYDMVFYGGKIDAKAWITDVDSVAIGPAGVLAVSTKWTSDAVVLSADDEWVRLVAGRAARQAELLAPMLRQKVSDVRICPLVVVWGPNVRSSSVPVTTVTVPRSDFGRVSVVAGNRRDEWLARFASQRLSDEQIGVLDHVAGEWIDSHDERHARNADARVRAQRMVRWAEIGALASAATAVAASGWLIAADLSHPVLRALGRFIHYGGGAVGAAFLLGPVAAALAAFTCRRP
ncbi:MAG: nuclease-related domain-containing protein [Acidimicrobiales bacterium]